MEIPSRRDSFLKVKTKDCIIILYERTTMKILVHPGTGTIIALDECVIVDTESLNEEDAAIFGDGDDEDRVMVAVKVGKKFA